MPRVTHRLREKIADAVIWCAFWLGAAVTWLLEKLGWDE